MEGPAREENLRESFLPQKSRPHLFRKGWRKGISVYREPTLAADDVLGVLPAFISHPHNNLIISVLQKRKLELRGLTGPAHVT